MSLQATDLKSYVRSLEIPPAGPYKREDHLYACGTQEGKIAISNERKGMHRLLRTRW